jgi:hypothetical protein
MATPEAKEFSDIKELNSYLPPSSSISQREFSAFFKDDWKVRPVPHIESGRSL